MVRVAVILTARPSWAKLEPVCRALKAMPEIDLQIIACASALLERYGRVVDVVRAQGYPVAEEVWSTYEGNRLVTSAKETGALLAELSAVLTRVLVDAVVICADRHEVLAAAQAATYLHIPLVHLQGGERSGSIDDRVRDAITQLADVHCVCTKRAAMRVYALTGQVDGIHMTGCPSIDLAKQALSAPPVTRDELMARGVGAELDPEQPFLMVAQHPVTSEVDQAAGQMHTTIQAIAGVPSVVLWPGQDAGSDVMARELRMALPGAPWRMIKTLPPTRFLRLLSQASVLVGNSSAGIREASYLGTPVVNIGSRQQGRERAANVLDVPHHPTAIVRAIQQQRSHGRYPRSGLYGTGEAGVRTAQILRDLRLRAPADRGDRVSAV